MSFRASGTYLDVEVDKQNESEYVAYIKIYPGNDEVVFNKIIMPQCEIAKAKEVGIDNTPNGPIFLGWTYEREGEYHQGELSDSITVQPKIRSENPVETVVYFKPQRGLKKVKVTVSGGWLNKLSVHRSLS